MNRLISKATPEGTLNYTYDAAGHVASIASSNVNGASMSYTYDDLNRLSRDFDGSEIADTERAEKRSRVEEDAAGAWKAHIIHWCRERVVPGSRRAVRTRRRKSPQPGGCYRASDS